MKPLFFLSRVGLLITIIFGTYGACAYPPLQPTTEAVPTIVFQDDFGRMDRVWIGPDYYANRLQDWRLSGGRLEATTTLATKPMRAVHLLTRALSARPGSFRMTVRTGPLTPPAGATLRPDSVRHDTWTGFLIGAGGDDVDYRISALVHHWPGFDGGLIVALDGTGQVVVRENTRAGTHGVRATLGPDNWPQIEAVVSSGPASSRDLRLELEASPAPDGLYTLRLDAYDAGTGALVANGQFAGLAPENFSGSVALVSHRSAWEEGPGYWFDDWTLEGDKVEAYPNRAFGPIMGTLYAVSRDVLRMTAQFGPLGAGDERSAHLEILRENTWHRIATVPIVEDSWTAHFRVPAWDPSQAYSYRVVYDLRSTPDRVDRHTYEGIVRAEPLDQDAFVLGTINCVHPNTVGSGAWNGSGFWHPHADLTRAMAAHNPDLLFFAGDQIYEGAPFGVVRASEEEAILDYLNHWYLWVWSFRDLTRDRPAIAIPDDHDMFHGNIWGAGGIAAEGPLRPLPANGGYMMGPRWVNAVHRTQTWNLPDPVDPTPIAQGITTYFTRLEYAGLSFAVVADRMFKSAPAPLLPEAQIVNGSQKNLAFDPLAADVPGAVLLGTRQLAFLEQWASDWSGDTWMKVVLSQTLFGNLSTLPADTPSWSVLPTLRYADPGEYIEGDAKTVDFDTNGWPQSGRNEALRVMRKAFAVHIGGDQHLGSVVRYGVDAFDDAGYAFIAPAAANVWPRRWFPSEAGENRRPGAPRYTGQFFDGFGNRMTVEAVSNPVLSGQEPAALYDRVPGYGIVRFDRMSREIVFEAWPRWVDPVAEPSGQFYGWPVRVAQRDNYTPPNAAWLPELQIVGMDDPVVQVIDEQTGLVEHTIRISGDRYRPRVPHPDRLYTLVVHGPGTETRTIQGLRPTPTATHTTPIEIRF